jgi:hypothetical protein
MGLIIAAYPFNMFFYFMFYTDTLSTLSLLTTYYLSAKYKSSPSCSASWPVYLAAHLAMLLVRTQ